MIFRTYSTKDYQLVCDFFIELNRDNKDHIHWNWARFEWMMGHPVFNSELIDSIGLWFDNERLIAIAIYDQYFGEAFVGTLPEYQSLYPELLIYAFNNLKDENGLGISICNNSLYEIDEAKKQGFVISEQTETVLLIKLDKEFYYQLPHNIHLEEINPNEHLEEMLWLFWQGFDHGNNKEECMAENKKTSSIRPHFNKFLSLVAVDEKGEKVGYCSLWYDKKTDYAYLEPLCVIPEYRRKGIAKALVYELLSRAKSLGAKVTYVISDQQFYKNVGFTFDRLFTFYWKK